MLGNQLQSRDADIDIGRLFAALRRDFFKILLVSLFLTGVVFAMLSLVSPKYTADTRVLIDANESVFTRPSTENQPSDQPVIDEESVASQVEIIRSSDLLLKVAAELDLASRAEFDETKNISAIKMGLIAFGLMADPAAQPLEQRVLKAMQERLNVYPADPARVVVIEFESKDAELAAAVPNALARAYVSLESRAQLDSTGQAADYLANEITQLQNELRDAEAKVADFRAARQVCLTKFGR
ncbi:MAG: Wzz/FepE/Etk N-terminal domain-containing protein [Ahrensia sp.]|nr:Wzz/FepE/Etk N-terminal domain-containing protein [Ahrensia sp.]